MDRMDGKVCVVTGASAGIGKETALGLAARGAHVLLVCRDRARGEAARAEVAARGPGGATLYLADLSSQADIRRVAGEIARDHARLDVLVNNAGVMIMRRQTTVDGLEATFATNHLGYFLLTVLLLERLTAAGNARVVNVSSGMHRRGSIPWDDLRYERRYRGLQAYADSKLANVLFTVELARRLAGTGVTANALHPGFVASRFGRNNRGLIQLVLTLGRPFAIDARTGAETPIYLASSPAVAGQTGGYYYRCRPARTSWRARDPEAAARLWRVSAELCGLPADAGVATRPAA